MPEASKTSRAGPIKRRPRARYACLNCRSRRVRCDVSESGIKCSNCRFYKQECVLSEKEKSQFMFMRLGPPSHPQPPRIESNQPNPFFLPTVVDFSGPVTACNAPSLAAPHSLPIGGARCVHGKPSKTLNQPSGQCVSLQHGNATFGRPPVQFEGLGNAELIASSNAQPIDLPINGYRQSSTTYGEPDERTQLRLPPSSPHTSTVPFSYYPFLSLKSMHHKAPEDVSYLEAQHCLRVPSPKILEKFMNKYFTHVHPYLPLVNEAQFWPMFAQPLRFGMTVTEDTEKPTMSLFLFQAMLFAAAGYVSRKIASDLGFSSVRQAREQFWNRAKLLFEFEFESDPVSISQGCLLLTYHTSRNFLKTNTYWLESAITSAQRGSVHLYYVDSDHSTREQKRNKLLWWCCIVRDRILPLGVRRALNVTFDHFPYDKYPLTIEDLEDEFDYSRIYDAATKRKQAELFITQCQFAIAVTDTVRTIYPLQQTPATCSAKLGDQDQEKSLADIQMCKSKLSAWYQDCHLCPLDDYDKTDRSVVVGSSMMHMYFYSAVLGLCLFERLVLKDLAQHSGVEQVNRIRDCFWQFENTMEGMTRQTGELLRLDLASYLPISMAAYISLPLLLSILDVKLARQDAASALKHRRFGVFLEAMKTYEPRFLETEFAWQLLRITTDFLDIENPTHQRRFLAEQKQETPKDDPDDAAGQTTTSILSKSPSTALMPSKSWKEMFLLKPEKFYPMVLLFDLGIAQSKIPSHGDVFARLSVFESSAALTRTVSRPTWGPQVSCWQNASLAYLKHLLHPEDGNSENDYQGRVQEVTMDDQEQPPVVDVTDESWMPGVGDDLGLTIPSPSFVSDLFDSIIVT